MGFGIGLGEGKIRINLSEKARAIMEYDMKAFGVSSEGGFINEVFTNYYDKSKASMTLYLQDLENSYQELFADKKMSDKSKDAAIDALKAKEKDEIQRWIKEKLSYKGSREKKHNTLYHIRKNNIDYIDSCGETEIYDGKAGDYIKCVIEDYSDLPYVERERVYFRSIFQMIEDACNLGKMLKVKIKNHYVKNNGDGFMEYHVFPYRILEDPLSSQSYLACYTKRLDQGANSKRPASFLIRRLLDVKMLSAKAFISEEDKRQLDKAIESKSVEYLVGDIETVKVRLTAEGENQYKIRMRYRPYEDKDAQEGDIHVFYCTPFQANQYFYSFGEEAEIISPAFLREQFKISYTKAAALYK